jgi:hypothetical protein
MAVVDRTVMDPTFATRDLVRSLHRTPRHVVLVLTEHEARLFDPSGHDTAPAGRAVPTGQPDTPASPARSSQLAIDRWLRSASLRLASAATAS